MLVSVIIPAYNRAGTIERSVRSVLDQTVKELEVIVVDDCSTDQTESVVLQIHDNRVRYDRLGEQSGACVTRNRGVDLARGELIAFQDSDDFWKPEKLEKQLYALKEYGADICFSSLNRHYPGSGKKDIGLSPHQWGQTVLTQPRRGVPDRREGLSPLSLSGDKGMVFPPDDTLSDGFLDVHTLRRKSCVSTQTILSQKKIFEKYRFDPLVKKGQDYDWIIRAALEYSVYFIKEPLVEQYLQKDSISLGGAEKIVESRRYFLEKYKSECEEDKDFKLYLLKQLAHNKVLCSMDASREYGEICRLERTPHNLLCASLARMHLLHLLIKPAR